MSLCESIDTLAMAYLDDELAAEERHELEAHLCECAVCRGHVDIERHEHDLLRKALAAPPASELLRAKLARALDAEDKVQRRRWTQYVLPGSAMCAAAAAIAVFVSVNPNSPPEVGPVSRAAVRAEMRSLPLEVQGASTAPFVRRNFAQLELPQENALIGARLLPQAVDGHDGMLMSYQMDSEHGSYVMSVLAVRDLRDGEMQDGDEIHIGAGRTLHILEEAGRTTVSYVDPARHIGYYYMAPDLSPNELVGVVSGLIPR